MGTLRRPFYRNRSLQPNTGGGAVTASGLLATTGDPVQPIPLSRNSGRAYAAPGTEEYNALSMTDEDVDLFHGALVKRLPLTLPPGRNGLQPKADLIYDSRLGNGLIGVGWRLDITSIVGSSTKFSDEETGRFLLLSGTGAEPLTMITTTATESEFRLQNSPLSPVIIRRILNGHSEWERIDNDGTHFRFGETTESRIEVKKREEWSITSITDSFGNSIKYEYAQDHGVVLPLYYLYNRISTQASTPENSACDTRIDYNDCVQFSWIPRTDKETTFRGSEATVYVRLGAISVRSGGHPYASYELSYGANQSEYSDVSGRTLLRAVTMAGAKGQTKRTIASFEYSGNSGWTTFISGISSLPSKEVAVVGRFSPEGRDAIMFLPEANKHEWHLLKLDNSYSLHSETWQPGPDARWSFQVDINTPGLNVHYRLIMPVPYSSLLGDYTGDGMMDIINPIINFNAFSSVNTSLLSTDWELYYSSGVGWLPASHVWQHAPTLYVGFSRAADFTSATACRVGYFNQDAKADVACIDAATGRWTMAFSTGNGFNVQPWPGPTLPPRDGTIVGYPSCFSADLNGDGLTDLLCALDSTFRIWSVAITGSAVVTRTLPDEVGKGCLVGDINGDGLADLVCKAISGEGIWRTYYSNGTGWQPAVNWAGPSISQASDCLLLNYQGTEPLDLVCPNGDDFWVFSHLNMQTPKYDIIPLQQMRSGPDKNRCFFGDFEGSGYEQIMCSTKDGMSTLLFGRNLYPDSLVLFKDEIGNETSYTYGEKRSTSNCRCPLPLKVISKIHHKGAQTDFDKTFAYDDGYFEVEQKEFRGFGHVQVTTHTLEAPLTTDVWFYQGDTATVPMSSSAYARFAGLPYRIVRGSEPGRPSVQYDYEYVTDNAVAPPFSVSLRRSTVTRSDCINLACGTDVDRISVVNVDRRGNLVSRLTIDPTSPNSALFALSEYESVNDGSLNTRLVSQTSLALCTAISNMCDRSAAPASLLEKVHSTERETLNFTKAAIVSAENFAYTNNSCTTEGPILNQRILYVPSQVSSSLSFPDTWSTERLSFDVHGNLICRADANNHQYLFGYDDVGLHQTTTKGPSGDIETAEYNRGDSSIPAGLLLSRQVNGKEVVKYFYDEFGRVAETRYPDGYFVTSEYSVKPNELQITKRDSNNDWIEVSSDGLNRPIALRRNSLAGTVESEIVYSENGQIRSVTQPHRENSPGERTFFLYDGLGRVTAVNQGLLRYSQVCYSGNRVRVIDANHHVTDVVFDMNKNVLASTKFDLEVADCNATLGANAKVISKVVYGRDIAGRTVNVDGGSGTFVTYEWDQMGRIVRIHENGLREKEIVYDATGLPVTLKGFESDRIDLQYDSSDRLIKKTRQSGSKSITELSIEYFSGSPYPNSPKSISWQSGKGVFNYDNQGRPTKSTYDVHIGWLRSRHYEIETAYAPGGKISSIRYADGSSVSYVYTAGLIANIYREGQTLWTGEYDAQQRLTNEHFGNGLRRDISYSDIGMPTETIDSDVQGTVIRKESIKYDPVGNVVERTLNNKTLDYKYDSSDRLIEILGLDGQASTESFTYGLDDNLLSRSSLGDYIYNTSHPQEVQKIGSQLLAYDEFGRATKLMQGQIVYKNDGVEIHSQGIARTLKKVPVAGISTVSHGLTTEVDLNGFSNCRKSKDCENNVYGPNGVIAQFNTSGQIRYVHADFLGSMVMTTDSQSKVSETYIYDPFGSLPKKGDSSKQFLHLGFAGMSEIGGSSIYWTSYRLYDASIARFLSPDPQPNDGGIDRVGNRYAYAFNNPFRFRDPLGLQGTVIYPYPWYPTPEWTPSNPYSGGPNLGNPWVNPEYFGDIYVGQIPIQTGSMFDAPVSSFNISRSDITRMDAIDTSWDLFDVAMIFSGIRGVFKAVEAATELAGEALELADLPEVFIKSEHAAGRLAQDGLSEQMLSIESRIDQDVTQKWLEGLIQEERSTTFGPIDVGGVPIRYRAILRNGRVEVNTYYRSIRP